MSLDLTGASQLAPYDDEEEIQLMDTDGNNLQLDEPLIDTNTNAVEKDDDNNEEEEKPIEKEEHPPFLLVIEVCLIEERNEFNHLFILRN